MKGGIKRNKRLYEVEDGGVHHKKYDGCCTKQKVKIPKTA
jgi:hypothetical protein